MPRVIIYTRKKKSLFVSHKQAFNKVEYLCDTNVGEVVSNYENTSDKN